MDKSLLDKFQFVLLRRPVAVCNPRALILSCFLLEKTIHPDGLFSFLSVYSMVYWPKNLKEESICTTSAKSLYPI